MYQPVPGIDPRSSVFVGECIHITPQWQRQYAAVTVQWATSQFLIGSLSGETNFQERIYLDEKKMQ